MIPENTSRSDVANAIAAGAALADVKPVNDQLAVMVVPANYDVKQIDLTKFRETPFRHQGATTVADASSFVAYVNRFKDEGTLIYSDKDACSFVGVINDHVAHAPGWRDFTVTYSCPKSPEWLRWFGSSQHGDRKSGMAQATFAQFIEDNLPDIVRPTGAEMLEVSRMLEAKKDVKFASAIKLSDGSQQFTYEEDIQGTASRGQMQIPDLFTIAIPVFEGGTVYEIDARLRYRIDGGGKLMMWYELVRPHKVIEHAFQQALVEIRTGIADVAFFAI